MSKSDEARRLKKMIFEMQIQMAGASPERRVELRDAIELTERDLARLYSYGPEPVEDDDQRRPKRKA